MSPLFWAFVWALYAQSFQHLLECNKAYRIGIFPHFITFFYIPYLTASDVFVLTLYLEHFDCVLVGNRDTYLAYFSHLGSFKYKVIVCSRDKHVSLFSYQKRFYFSRL